MGRGCSAEYLTQCPTTLLHVPCLFCLHPAGKPGGFQPWKPTALSLAEPFAPAGDQRCSHIRGKGLLGLTSNPVGLHLDLRTMPVAKMEPESSHITFDAIEGLGLFSKSQA